MCLLNSIKIFFSYLSTIKKCLVYHLKELKPKDLHRLNIGVKVKYLSKVIESKGEHMKFEQRNTAVEAIARRKSVNCKNA